MELQDKLERLAALISKHTEERMRSQYHYKGIEMEWEVRIKLGKKYFKIDVGSSGKYMVEIATEKIYGIKGYGVIHRGYRFGTLDTIDQWNWGGYRAFRKEVTYV